VADAEIIPIGTRGRPGRGTGNAKPSASARDLAGNAKPKPAAAGEKEAAAATTGSRSGSSSRRTKPRRAASVPKGPRPVRDADPVETETPGPDSARSSSPHGADAGPGPADAPGGAPDAPGAAAGPSAHTGEQQRSDDDGTATIDWMRAFTFAAKELFGDDWEDKLAELIVFLRRRATGDYTVDEYGFDREMTERFLYSAIRPLADKWFRVEVRGAENIPADGGALVVSNHSGTFPLDGLVTGVSIFDHTGRHLRPLGADLVFRLPVVGELARMGGATLACNEDAERMLRGGELVGVWPEGFKGIGKPYSDRYKLQRFGRGGFVSAAMRTGVPIVPCSVVGAEEIYPLVGNLPSLARLLGVPYIPITPFFPALGLLGLIPLPSKWLIEFGEPIRTDSYEAGAADDPMLVFNVTDQVRETVQQTLYSLLMQRRSVFH
jgi:1-acyl-sn-glycerol-3-phosphate acyltransferase